SASVRATFAPSRRARRLRPYDSRRTSMRAAGRRRLRWAFAASFLAAGAVVLVQSGPERARLPPRRLGPEALLRACAPFLALNPARFATPPTEPPVSSALAPVSSEGPEDDTPPSTLEEQRQALFRTMASALGLSEPTMAAVREIVEASPLMG